MRLKNHEFTLLRTPEYQVDVNLKDVVLCKAVLIFFLNGRVDCFGNESFMGWKKVFEHGLGVLQERNSKLIKLENIGFGLRNLILFQGLQVFVLQIKQL